MYVYSKKKGCISVYVHTCVHPMSFHLVGPSPSPSPAAPVPLRRQQRIFLRGCIDLVSYSCCCSSNILVYCSTLIPDLFFCRTVGTVLVIASSYLLQQVEAEALTRSWGKYGQKLLSNLKLCLAHQCWRYVFLSVMRCFRSCCSSLLFILL